MNDIFCWFLAVAFSFVAAISGWIFAHDTIKLECQKLGGFYVGQTIFECKEKTQ